MSLTTFNQLFNSHLLNTLFTFTIPEKFCKNPAQLEKDFVNSKIIISLTCKKCEQPKDYQFRLITPKNEMKCGCAKTIQAMLDIYALETKHASNEKEHLLTFEPTLSADSSISINFKWFSETDNNYFIRKCCNSFQVHSSKLHKLINKPCPLECEQKEPKIHKIIYPNHQQVLFNSYIKKEIEQIKNSQEYKDLQYTTFLSKAFLANEYHHQKLDIDFLVQNKKYDILEILLESFDKISYKDMMKFVTKHTALLTVHDTLSDSLEDINLFYKRIDTLKECKRIKLSSKDTPTQVINLIMKNIDTFNVDKYISNSFEAVLTYNCINKDYSFIDENSFECKQCETIFEADKKTQNLYVKGKQSCPICYPVENQQEMNKNDKDEPILTFNYVKTRKY